MKLGEKLDNLLDEYDLSQKQLSKELHISASTLNGYIRGNREPDYATLIRLARYFDVSTDYLLGVTNVKKCSVKDLDIREGDLVGTYRCLQQEKQELLLEQAHLYHKYDLKRKEKRNRRQ